MFARFSLLLFAILCRCLSPFGQMIDRFCLHNAGITGMNTFEKVKKRFESFTLQIHFEKFLNHLYLNK